MSRKAIYKDTSLCVGCQACRVACQMENSLKPEQVYIRLIEVEKGKYPQTSFLLARKSCMHCGKAPCIEVCPADALTKDESGFTRFDRNKCVGCENCIDHCPYEVPEMVDGKAERCLACLDLVKAGQRPACVETCIANALRFGDRLTLIAEGEKRVAQLQKVFPHAQLYGKDIQGGLGLLQVLRDRAETFKLPG